jgi:hypothetical protein
MILAHAVPLFATRGRSGCTDEEDGLVAKVGTSKKGSTISLLAAVHLVCMLQAQMKKRSSLVRSYENIAFIFRLESPRISALFQCVVYTVCVSSGKWGRV